MSEVKQPCCGRVSGEWRSRPCKHTGKLEHEGKFYCGLHHPPTIWAKRTAKEAIWQKEWEAKSNANKAAEAAKAELKRRAEAYLDLLAALQDAQRAINGMKDAAETGAVIGDEQGMAEALEAISREGLEADTAIRSALARATK